MPDPNIHLSDAARAFAEAKAKEKGLEGPDQFVESLVKRAIRREEKRMQLEALLIEGLERGPLEPLTDQDWVDMKNRLRNRLAARNPS